MSLLVFGVGLAIVAAIWFFHLRTARKAEAAGTWPSAPGVVQTSAVREKVESDSEGDSETAYYPEVGYRWTVQGQDYAGRRIAFGEAPRFAREAAAQAICARYPVGAAVSVRYNPDQPGEAVLESRKPSPFKAIVFTAVILIMTVAAGLALA